MVSDHVTSLVTSRVFTNNEVTNLLTNHKYSKLSIFKHKVTNVLNTKVSNCALLVTWLVTRLVTWTLTTG